jgi:dihydropteroate synthase
MRDLFTLLEADRTLVMGILNVTPDSFSDGGKYLTIEHAIDHALDMVASGADIIDIGGASTRPAGATYGEGAASVMEAEELDRVLPIITQFRKRDQETLISIDTTRSGIARIACAAGADIINDVSAGTIDPDMFATAFALDAPIILMHGYGPEFEKSSLEEYVYEDIVADVMIYLAERIGVARKAGVREVLADVGIGFAKSYHDNLKILRHHSRFSGLGVPLVLGASRKSSIGRALSRSGAIPPPAQRLYGSLAVACYGAEHGAGIVRVHDVKPTVEALTVLNTIRSIRDEVVS